MKRDVRNAILEAGADLIHRQGFHHTGLKDILEAAKVPKGSFYFYFKSKEDFGLALVEHFRITMGQRAERTLLDPERPPLERLAAFFTGAKEKFAALDCTAGCPIGNLAQEMSDLSPDMRQAVDASLRRMTQRLALVIAEARGLGQIAPDSDPESLAAFILDAWEGAMIRMKAEKSVEPLVRFEHYVFNCLLR